jgi:hypothetical protein
MKPFISNENYLLCEGSLITEKYLGATKKKSEQNSIRRGNVSWINFACHKKKRPSQKLTGAAESA